MHGQAEGKLKGASGDGQRHGPARTRPAGAQIQPRPIRYHMWLSQLSYGMTWPARIA